jgi:hypothetical protein
MVPRRYEPASDWIASDEDSWLLPPGDEKPPALEWPSQTLNVRRYGKRWSVRSPLAYCLLTRVAMPSYRLIQAGSSWPRIAVATAK